MRLDVPTEVEAKHVNKDTSARTFFHYDESRLPRRQRSDCHDTLMASKKPPANLASVPYAAGAQPALISLMASAAIDVENIRHIGRQCCRVDVRLLLGVVADRGGRAQTQQTPEGHGVPLSHKAIQQLAIGHGRSSHRHLLEPTSGDPFNSGHTNASTVILHPGGLADSTFSKKWPRRPEKQLIPSKQFGAWITDTNWGW
jgi:hypothetical protein